MDDKGFGTIEFEGLQIPVYKEPMQEFFLALQPPDAMPYMIVPPDTTPEDVVRFVTERQDAIRELRVDMIKRFQKNKSLKCRYRTGDVAYLFGRPFMLRVFPEASTNKKPKGIRVRSNVRATMRSDLSVIDLFLPNAGNYDQGKAAFLSYAKPIFLQNVTSLVQQSTSRLFPDQPAPRSVKVRPLRDSWVHIDEKKDVVWFSENLIPYPPDCVVYAYLAELIKLRAPEAKPQEVNDLLDVGVPGWQQLREILADPSSPYSNQ